MKTKSCGNVPEFIQKFLSTNPSLREIKVFINMYVVEDPFIHGNYNSSEAWMAPRDGGNKWSIEITF